MIKWLAGFITAPLIEGAVGAYKAKLAAGNDRDRIAADLAARELVLQQREAELAAQERTAALGMWYEPAHLFAYIMVVYFAKVVIWDKVLGHLTGGTTDPLTGDAATWAGLVFAFYLGRRGLENVARILKR